MSAEQKPYLDTVIDERIIPMLKEVSSVFAPKVELVRKYAQETDTPPFWWVYQGGISSTPVANGRYTTYATVNMRLVTGNAKQTGYAGQLESKLWVWLPTVVHYLQERRGLIYQLGQSAPDNLDPKGVTVNDFTPFGLFDDGTAHIGTEGQVILPFTFYVTPYPGNP